MAESQEEDRNKSDKMIEVLNKNMDMMNTINQNIVNLIEQTKEMNKLLVSETKANKIQFAMKRCEVGAFEYYENGRHSRTQVLVGNILDSFFRGNGHYLLQEATVENPYYHRGKAPEDDKKAFCDKIVAQMELVLGHKPQVTDGGSGKFAIYY
ncbi:unnamed protein product [Cylindrotheca closterium]|uniref:Uncharacterized protein n=1 Tax=Cylindrotheca closterium TaxID=2856 RepID=A0AAD2G0W1_9STRA|nr:unnamed protein product [Cylindrotheca closterium]